MPRACLLCVSSCVLGFVVSLSVCVYPVQAATAVTPAVTASTPNSSRASSVGASPFSAVVRFRHFPLFKLFFSVIERTLRGLFAIVTTLVTNHTWAKILALIIAVALLLWYGP